MADIAHKNIFQGRLASLDLVEFTAACDGTRNPCLDRIVCIDHAVRTKQAGAGRQRADAHAGDTLGGEKRGFESLLIAFGFDGDAAGFFGCTLQTLR